jgi:hypothetical protein
MPFTDLNSLSGNFIVPETTFHVREHAEKAVREKAVMEPGVQVDPHRHHADKAPCAFSDRRAKVLITD